MAKLFFEYCVWKSTQIFKSLGLVGCFAVTLIVGCFIAYFIKLTPLNQQIEDTQSQLTNAENAQKIKLTTQPRPIKSIADEVALFNLSLPEYSYLNNWLGQIYQAALKLKITLDNGDYQYIQTKKSQIGSETNISKYEIYLPVTGDYAHIKRLIAEVLQIHPAMALTELRMTRESVDSTKLEARLMFTLFFKSDSK